MNGASKLEKAFNFSTDELSLNKSGQVSDRQRTVLDKYIAIYRKTVPISNFVFGAMALAVTAFAVFVDIGEDPVARLAPIGVSALVWLIFLFTRRSGRRMLSEFREARVSTLEGPVQLKAKEIKEPGRRYGTAFIVKVGSKKIQLEAPEGYKALSDGASYRFFKVGRSRVPVVLSVEEL